ncbi:MAG: MerR family transcriptional regulator, partial [Planctomycetota bacterium]|nr:MerR family transcriptional regulator [Planctomycetota bacterium]
MLRDKAVLRDKKVALTGRLVAMTHREAAQLIEDFGGTAAQTPTRDTDFLVVGREGLPLGDDGQPTANLLAARKLQALGYAIEIVSEEAFLSKLHLLEDEQKIRRRYTIVQLTRILGVSRDRIRAWMRSGLIEPVETVHRLAYFDYQQVTSAKMLSDLVSSGLTPAQIRESLRRLSRWLPDTDFSLSQLSVLEASQQLLVRLEDGRLAEPSGQLLMTFEPDQQATLALDAADKTAEQWFHEA